MNKKVAGFLVLVTVISWSLVRAGFCGEAEGVSYEVAGTWEGKALIIVSWCSQKELDVLVKINPDGAVTGKVGDAKLSDGLFKRNRGWLGRKLNIKSDYIIVGKLEGAIVQKEGIIRKGVKMPINIKDGKLVGGLHTSGSKFGGKERMILTAFDMSLSRRNKP
ncbi:hypothetical protein KAX00_01410 [bacterium]|nr:hypothetical protein [bacterium]